MASIHDAVRFKQPDLDKMLDYDNWPRKSLVDHFLQPGLDPAAFLNLSRRATAKSPASFASGLCRVPGWTTCAQRRALFAGSVPRAAPDGRHRGQADALTATNYRANGMYLWYSFGTWLR